MSSISLRTESTSSSQIENLTVGAKKLALQELGEGNGGNAAVVVGNVRAMEAALHLADKIDSSNLKEVHRALLSQTASSIMNGSVIVGEFRTGLVWVGGDLAGPRGAAHIAPQVELIDASMEDLFSFIDRDDLPVVLQCAIAHAQFETIRPFGDGNGRVGRALVHAILRNKEMIRNVTAPVSAGLLTDMSRYFDALNSFRQGDARPIVERFTAACRFASDTGIRLIDALVAQLDEAKERLAGVRSDSAVWKILPYLIEQPIINPEYLMKRVELPRARARQALNTLESKGVLSTNEGGRRNKVWEHQGILAVLDAYGQQLRRG
jgi:Fic family protein